MAKIRNKSGRRLSVPLLRRDVDPGETVDVPDEWLTQYAWPENTWTVTSRTSKKDGE
jgi:hypothetical protein